MFTLGSTYGILPDKRSLEDSGTDTTFRLDTNTVPTQGRILHSGWMLIMYSGTDTSFRLDTNNVLRNGYYPGSLKSPEGCFNPASFEDI